jgi:hypothetical protein
MAVEVLVLPGMLPHADWQIVIDVSNSRSAFRKASGFLPIDNDYFPPHLKFQQHPLGTSELISLLLWSSLNLRIIIACSLL